MGKGFNNYMCKKFFHPASRDNLKRVWMAQQKDDAYKKKQEELRVQYEKEQDLYNNKAMLSKESKDKLSVNFMYEPPPGAKKEREKEENEPEYKFEWQRKYNAPREDYCKGNSEIQDQPFGILVRNVRCIKCRKWGHINTDKECPLYNQSVTSEIANEQSDALSLLRGMREDGLRMRKTALDAQQHVEVPRFKTAEPEEETIDETELQFLKSLSTKAKLKLLKKLERLESNGMKKDDSTDSDSEESDTETSGKKKKKLKKKKNKEKESKKDEKKKKKKAKKYDSDDSEDKEETHSKKRRVYESKENGKKSKRRRRDSSSSDSSESEVEDRKDKRKHKKKHTRRREAESSEIESSSESDEERKGRKPHKHRKPERPVERERNGKGKGRSEESRHRKRSRSRSPQRKHAMHR